MTVVVRGEARHQALALGHQQAFLHGQVVLEVTNLFLDVHDGVLHPFRSQDAQWVHRRDQVVVGLAKLPVRTGVAGRPVKLLGVHLDAQSIGGGVARHGIPCAEAINDDHRQHDGRNHRPDDLQPVVVGKEGGLAVLVVGVFPREVEEERVHQNEHSSDDPDVEAHQRVQRHTVHRGSRRSVVSIGPVEVGRRSKEHDDECQEQIGVQTGVGVGDVLLTASRNAGREFVDFRQLPDGNDADDDDQKDEQLHIDSVWGQ